MVKEWIKVSQLQGIVDDIDKYAIAWAKDDSQAVNKIIKALDDAANLLTQLMSTVSRVTGIDLREIDTIRESLLTILRGTRRRLDKVKECVDKLDELYKNIRFLDRVIDEIIGNYLFLCEKYNLEAIRNHSQEFWAPYNKLKDTCKALKKYWETKIRPAVQTPTQFENLFEQLLSAQLIPEFKKHLEDVYNSIEFPFPLNDQDYNALGPQIRARTDYIYAGQKHMLDEGVKTVLKNTIESFEGYKKAYQEKQSILS